MNVFRRTVTRLLVIALLAGTLAGCASRPSSPAGLHRRTSPLPNRPPSAVFEVGRDRLRILHGGEVTFEILRGLIRSARAEVDLEMYELGRDDMVAELIAAHDRGAGVKVIVDPTVDVSAAAEQTLRAAGVDVLEYPVRKMMIDHVKLLVIDGTTAVVGGINWGSASAFNHDFDAVLQGPAAANLERVFRRDLVTCGVRTTVPDAVSDSAVLVATTLPGADIRPLALSVIDKATESLDLELYVITDQGVVRALIAARHRGVRVHVLLDPSERPSDGPAAELRAAGVDVRVYRSGGELLHAKLVDADSRTVLFGSANWSAGGFARNHECDIEITADVAVAADIGAAISADWAAS